LKTLLQSLSFEILFFSSQKQADLGQFLTFFEKISRIYQENSQVKPKNITLVSIDTRLVAKHDQAEFQLATCYPDQLRQMFDLFSRKFQSFSTKLLSKFLKSQILRTHLYLSISNACSCQISALQLLPRRI
jgi:hypothetical protein